MHLPCKLELFSSSSSNSIVPSLYIQLIDNITGTKKQSSIYIKRRGNKLKKLEQKGDDQGEEVVT